MILKLLKMSAFAIIFIDCANNVNFAFGKNRFSICFNPTTLAIASGSAF